MNLSLRLAAIDAAVAPSAIPRHEGTRSRALSLVELLGPGKEHPDYARLQQGQRHVASLVQAIKNSPAWKDTAIGIAHNKNGGPWGHAAPPHGDRSGPRNRVPAITISPCAKMGYFDDTRYKTVSIRKLSEKCRNLQPLCTRGPAAVVTDSFVSSPRTRSWRSSAGVL